jgi:hypothetical protein
MFSVPSASAAPARGTFDDVLDGIGDDSVLPIEGAIPSASSAAVGADDDAAKRRRRDVAAPPGLEGQISTLQADVGAIHAATASRDSQLLSMIDKVTGPVRLPSDTQNSLVKLMHSHGEKIRVLHKKINRSDKFEKDLGSAMRGVWPPGMPRFKLDVKSTGYSSVAPPALLEFHCDAPTHRDGQPSRICDVLKHMHEQYSIFVARCHKHAVDDEANSLRDTVQPDVFISEAQNFGLQQRAAVVSLGEKLGLRVGKAAEPASALTRAQAELLYEKLLISISKDLEAEVSSIAKAKLAEERRLERLTSASHQDLFLRSVDQRVDARLRSQGRKPENSDGFHPSRDVGINYSKAYINRFDTGFDKASAIDHLVAPPGLVRPSPKPKAKPQPKSKAAPKAKPKNDAAGSKASKWNTPPPSDKAKGKGKGKDPLKGKGKGKPDPKGGKSGQSDGKGKNGKGKGKGGCKGGK